MLHKSSKAQASIEFISMVSVALFILIALVIVNTYQAQAAHDASVRSNAQRVCNDFAAGINLAASGGSGFKAHIFLPLNVRGQSYAIGITGKTVHLNASDKTVFCRLITSNVSYATISPGNIILENLNETIIVR